MYLENQNVTRTDYKQYHRENKDNVYPSISFCIRQPFLNEELKRYGDNISISTYARFLKGLHWDDRMLKIDYDKVTVSLKQALLDVWIYTYSPTEGNRQDKYSFSQIAKSLVFASLIKTGKNSKAKNLEWLSKFYVSFRSSLRKCFSFDVPFIDDKTVSSINLILKKGILNSYDKKFRVYIHLPGQRFASYNTMKYDFDSILSTKSNPRMLFRIKTVEVISRRNTKKNQCHEDWRNYDQYIMNGIMLDTECRPTHWKTSKNISLCYKSHQMKEFKDEPNQGKLDSFDPPCRAAQSLPYEFVTLDMPKWDQGRKRFTPF